MWIQNFASRTIDTAKVFISSITFGEARLTKTAEEKFSANEIGSFFRINFRTSDQYEQLLVVEYTASEAKELYTKLGIALKEHT